MKIVRALPITFLVMILSIVLFSMGAALNWNYIYIVLFYSSFTISFFAICIIFNNFIDCLEDLVKNKHSDKEKSE